MPTYQLLVNSVDRFDKLLSKTLRSTAYEGGQVGSMSFELADRDLALTFTAWQEVLFLVDGTTFWGGYIVRATPRIYPGGRVWQISAETHATLLNRTPPVRHTYSDENAADIIVDMFDRAGLTAFDVSSFVDTGFMVSLFTTEGDKLSDNLDRLAALAGWTWWISSDMELFFGPTTMSTCPMKIVSINQAFDFGDGAAAGAAVAFPPFLGAGPLNTYLPSGEPSVTVDASQIRNRITVRGGQVPSDEHIDNFLGDETTTRFLLSNKPVLDIVRITLNGTLQWHGYDWTDDNFNDYDCLVDYTAGTVRWQDAPTIGDSIVVVYRSLETLTGTFSNAASYTKFGRWFDYEIVDQSITTLASAEQAAIAMMAEYADEVVSATIELEFFGPRAGQRIEITFPILNLSGFYPIRQVTSELDKVTQEIRSVLRVGGRNERLSQAIALASGGGRPYGPPPADYGGQTPVIAGEVEVLRVNDRIEVIDRSTAFISAANYGDATGVVVLFDPVTQTGQVLGLDSGTMQAKISSDGRIRWNGGFGVLDAGGMYIGAVQSFATQGVQAEYNGGTPRLYAGDGSTNYLKWDGAAAYVSGTIYAAAGYFSGSVYVGTADPRILIDGANKRIESTNFASGTAGFRLDGANGDAEFNNVTVRGSILAGSLTYGYVLATSGSIWVTPASGKAIASFTSNDTSFYIYLEDPEGMSHAAAGALWNVGDIIRVKEPLVGDLWATINQKVDFITTWRIRVVKNSPGAGTNYTFAAGATILNYGASGAGWLRLTADATNSPYLSIGTHAGSPWSAMTERVRLGNLNGISGASGYGLWTDNGFFTGTISASAGSIGGWTIGSGVLTAGTGANAVGMAPGTYPFYAGSSTASSAPFRVSTAGAVTASSGTIAGWTLTDTKLYWEDQVNYRGIGMATYNDAGGYAFWAGDHRPSYAEFRVSNNGALWATSATITGDISASAGSIGGWTIGSGVLTAGTGANAVGMAPGSYPFYAGSSTASSAPFRVSTAGAVTASSGTIAGWTLTATKLYWEDQVNYRGIGMATYNDAGGYAFWAGDHRPSYAEFRVSNNGALWATSATITGDITASSGSITGTLSMGASGIITGTYYRITQGSIVLHSDQYALLVKDSGTGSTRLQIYATSGGNAVFDGISGTATISATGGVICASGTASGSVELKVNSTAVVRAEAAKLGFFNVTPVVRPSAYTFTNGSSDRSINCTSTTLTELANVVYTIWTDLKNLGLLQ